MGRIPKALAAGLMIMAPALNGTAQPVGLVLNPIFGDHMVLQQGQPIKVWGTTAPGERVRASLAGASATAKADSRGRFSLLLPALPAGGPHELQVAAASGTATARDVMVGEVWLASGQSNMEWRLGNLPNSKADVAKADLPMLRYFTVARAESPKPLAAVQGKWTVVGPATAGESSAVAFYFSRALGKELKVPVGIVHASWGGTSGEAWTPKASMEAEKALAPAFARWEAQPAAAKKLRSGGPFWLEIRGMQMPRVGKITDLAVHLGVDSPGVGTAWECQAADGAEMRFIPKQGKARLEGKVAASGWAHSFCWIRDDHAPEDLSRARALEFEARGSGSFLVKLAQPDIHDGDFHCTKHFAATKAWKKYRFKVPELAQEGWGKPVSFTPQALDRVFIVCVDESVPGYPEAPGGLFNGMIAPLAGYGFAGALWYQGETNIGRADEYKVLLPALIRGWRERLGLPDLAFLTVQLPGWADPNGRNRPPSAIAELREAQEASLALPRTGLAVTLELGEADNVHPINKKPVGDRLCNEALSVAYGRQGLPRSPRLAAVARKGAELRLRFEHGPLKPAKGAVKGFELAGADGLWGPAEALILGKDEVLVRSDHVPDPVQVRYAWADFPEATLFNTAGLPAAPFRARVEAEKGFAFMP